MLEETGKGRAINKIKNCKFLSAQHHVGKQVVGKTRLVIHVLHKDAVDDIEYSIYVYICDE